MFTCFYPVGAGERAYPWHTWMTGVVPGGTSLKRQVFVNGRISWNNAGRRCKTQVRIDIVHHWTGRIWRDIFDLFMLASVSENLDILFDAFGAEVAQKHVFGLDEPPWIWNIIFKLHIIFTCVYMLYIIHTHTHTHTLYIYIYIYYIYIEVAIFELQNSG